MYADSLWRKGRDGREKGSMLGSHTHKLRLADTVVRKPELKSPWPLCCTYSAQPILVAPDSSTLRPPLAQPSNVFVAFSKTKNTIRDDNAKIETAQQEGQKYRTIIHAAAQHTMEGTGGSPSGSNLTTSVIQSAVIYHTLEEAPDSHVTLAYSQILLRAGTHSRI